MHPPWLLSVWFHVHQTFHSLWCHGCWLQVEGAIECFICRFCGVCSIWSHQVKSDVCLINKLAPVCDWDDYGRLASPAMKWFFHVWTAHFAAFVALFGLIKLRVMFVWSTSWHQYVIGNDLGRLASPSMKWFFHVWMAHFAAFVQQLSGGTYRTVTFWIAVKCSVSADISLSNFCFCGVRPALWRMVQKCLYA